MKALITALTMFLCSASFGQIHNGKSLKPDSSNYPNVYVAHLYSDDLSSTFAIWVKKEVKMHKHEHHTEVVTILKGRGVMTLGDVTSNIKKGDVIVIPMNTPHSVVTQSRKPLKVISVQTPKFVGKDRIWLEEVEK